MRCDENDAMRRRRCSSTAASAFCPFFGPRGHADGVRPVSNQTVDSSSRGRGWEPSSMRHEGGRGRFRFLAGWLAGCAIAGAADKPDFLPSAVIKLNLVTPRSRLALSCAFCCSLTRRPSKLLTNASRRSSRVLGSYRKYCRKDDQDFPSLDKAGASINPPWLTDRNHVQETWPTYTRFPNRKTSPHSDRSQPQALERRP
ncbi:hypothetical protein IWX90DRAFT_210578 [Phyllosticta citrichinensis]|uniref:Uncharacterized protein n=1 Tax=Phyllosticta citrichinensis TaxID=1130410 RepID=A0ABR1XSZ5_9PEZI